ncbi:MAG TPA: CBS domain-containing protein [Salinimicrobium sp.]|nr:CBS domain-containing protein [Salinimicrobium sp.]
MTIQPYIINDVLPFPKNGSIGELKKLFNELILTHLPIEENGIYRGSISENDVRCFESSKQVGDYSYSLEEFFVRDSYNWLDILEAFAKNKTNIMPVLDEENNYLGYVELHDILNLFNSSPFLSEPGNIIVVENGIQDFSFSEISQIVESNGAKMYGAFISKIENDIAEITIKSSQSGINEIVQTFRRYGYNVVSDHQEDALNKELKERSKYLTKYLNI